jgi:hypothetical protein
MSLSLCCQEKKSLRSLSRMVGGSVCGIGSWEKYFSYVAIRTEDRLARRQLLYRLRYSDFVIVANKLNFEVMFDDFSVYQMFAETNSVFMKSK